MAAYNGEKYIAEQIESILGQTETDWKLVVRDDCSTDSTVGIVRRYREKYPEKITAFVSEKNSGSAKNNFFSLLRHADGDYCMFSDDDDVWLPDKIRVTLLKMKELEKTFGADLPLLIHTDLRVADEALKTISESMFQIQKLKSTRDRFPNLLSQNIVTGCTAMANRSLIHMATEAGLPERAVMHDWWLALLAAAFGGIGFVDAATVLYRQHGNNEMGAKDADDFSYNAGRLLHVGQARRALQNTYEQALEFYQKYGSKLKESDRAAVRDYGSIPRQKKWDRLRTLQRYDCWKTGFYRKLGQIWFS